ncbi:hypothetical protein GCM10022261_23230 [Brevibacterium daeguense]|uniref:Uncharacterized protein n=1 Tax=Brevibacterium daeguense TaxID=909936 RepID=A0ABP8ELI1_9MICO
MRKHLVPVAQLDAERGVRQSLDNGALDLNDPFFFGHIVRVPHLPATTAGRDSFVTRILFGCPGGIRFDRDLLCRESANRLLLCAKLMKRTATPCPPVTDQ